MSAAKPAVLVVDDKQNFLSLLTKVLGRHARVFTAGGVREALAVLEKEKLDVVVCDLRMPDGEGLEVLRALRSQGKNTPFILMTAYASVPTAVQAMREGAYDYVTKPFEPEELRSLVLRAAGETAVLSRGLQKGEAEQGFGRLLGQCTAMKELFRLIERVAPTDATVLILGETGTGKELVARELHERSPRASHRLVALNCAAIPRALLESELFGYAKGSFTGANSDHAGLFEEADGSTFFLDELGELRRTLQAKLTRVLEERAVRRIGESRERKVDVRLLGATHRDLQAMVRSGAFREDLWYRLNVCVLKLPPLRERGEDVVLLAHHFLATRAPGGPRGFTEEALAALRAYSWPGNVRELRSVIERAVIVEERERIALSSLPEELRVKQNSGAQATEHDWASMSYREAVDALRDEGVPRYLRALLERHKGNVSMAAAQAGVERASFHRLLRRHGIDAEMFRGTVPEE